MGGSCGGIRIRCGRGWGRRPPELHGSGSSNLSSVEASDNLDAVQIDMWLHPLFVISTERTWLVSV
jgi:hypothetical protein